MGKIRRALRRPFETAALRFALAVVPLLPRTVLLGLAQLAGRLGSFFDLRGRRIGRANLNVAFGGEKSAREKRRILRVAYITFSRTLLDVIWFGRHSVQRLEKYVDIDESMGRFFDKKSQIWISAHFGSWEAGGQAMAHKSGPVYSIAMPVKNPEVNRLLIQRREVTGQTIIPREGALRKLLGVLRNNGKAVFLVDQNTDEEEGGIWVDFFGLPVPVTPAPAALAAKTGSEILICFCMPQRGGRYRVYMTKAIEPPADAGPEAAQRLTQQILSAIEQEIRTHPEYWLWMYKRWKKIYRPEDSERYPFYASRV
jgi:lauroyl/myristoyl acyltransferase